MTGAGAAGPVEGLRAAVEAIRLCTDLEPRVAIVLGTGLGGLGEAMEVNTVVPYGEIPGFPLSTVESHTGRLLAGTLEGVPAVAMQGRFHRYEGYSLQEVTFPIRVVRMMGAETLVVSGACGGLDPLLSLGDLVLLDDHINLMADTPLVGPNSEELGPRFPDMSEPYDRELQEWAQAAAMARAIPLKRGVYVAVVGPNLETRAEYRMLRTLGADVVGMSTVPEVIVARHMGMRVLGVSIVTDLCLPDALEVADVQSIIRTAAAAEPHLTALVRDVVGQL
ncbi:MAG: purine-nucleoside phosphorylase [Gammaproteobacteria bacterium]|nr:purine-nucleoside phosphorylase [Gammaproteobacteria bacterium]MDE0247074.1 purine-nucleoside phosphorylase [Gammaproteobacteria bacterium]